MPLNNTESRVTSSNVVFCPTNSPKDFGQVQVYTDIEQRKAASPHIEQENDFFYKKIEVLLLSELQQQAMRTLESLWPLTLYLPPQDHPCFCVLCRLHKLWGIKSVLLPPPIWDMPRRCKQKQFDLEHYTQMHQEFIGDLIRSYKSDLQ